MAKIIELRVEGFKGIKALTVRPDGSLIELTGRNGQGKTSALEAIMVAIEGKGSIAKPVRNGCDRCTIKLDIGELVIDREFTNTPTGQVTHRLVVTRENGSRVTATPQAVLDALTGALAFDPLAFTKWKPADQFDALRKFVKDFDFAAFDEAQTADYDARTEANRKAERAEAAAAAIKLPPGPKPQPVVLAALLAEIETAEKDNAEIKCRLGARVKARDDIDDLRDKAERLRAEAAEAERQANDLQARLDAAAPLPEPVDTAPLRSVLVSAEQINATIRAHDEREKLLGEARNARAISEALTKVREARAVAKAKAIAEAEMPVPGLDLVDGAVLFNGVPFSQASTAEQIKASMSIAMALNPTLKVILIDDGSALDSAARTLIAKIAEEKGFQVWITRVEEGGSVGIVIEDGEVKR